MTDNNGCKKRGKMVCQSRSSVCLFAASGSIIAAEFTKQNKGSSQLELYLLSLANQGLLLCML